MPKTKTKTNGEQQLPSPDPEAILSAAAAEEPAPPPEQPRKRRRRKPKVEEVPREIAPEGFALLVKALTGWIAGRAGEKWQATEEEAKNLGLALDRVVCKYFPLLLGYQEETALLSLVVLYLIPRITSPSPSPSPSPPPPESQPEAAQWSRWS